MTDNEVTALAKRARSGDAAALDALMAVLEPLIKRWCRPSIQRHPNHGDDILQTARLAVLKALQRPAPDSFHKFIFAWVQGEVTTYLASRRVVRRAPLVTHIDEITAREDTSWRYTGPVETCTPEGELLGHEAVAARWRQERRRRCITPACLRLVLQREGLHQDELARCLGVCPSLISKYGIGDVRIPPAVADRVVEILQLGDADLAALRRDAEEYARLVERYTPERIHAARELLGLSQADLGRRFVRDGRAHGQPTVSAFEDRRTRGPVARGRAPARGGAAPRLCFRRPIAALARDARGAPAPARGLALAADPTGTGGGRADQEGAGGAHRSAAKVHEPAFLGERPPAADGDVAGAAAAGRCASE